MDHLFLACESMETTKGERESVRCFWEILWAFFVDNYMHPKLRGLMEGMSTKQFRNTMRKDCTSFVCVKRGKVTARTFIRIAQMLTM